MMVDYFIFRQTQIQAQLQQERAEMPKPFSFAWKLLPYIPYSLTLPIFELSHSVYLCVLYDSHSKEQLFPCTAVVG